MALRRSGCARSCASKTLAWKERKARKIHEASLDEFRETLAKLLPLMGAEAVNEPA